MSLPQIVPLGKDLEERRHLALDGLGRALVERDPLGDHAARIEVALDEFEVFLGVEGRRALDPGMDRVRGDDVELLPGRQDVVAGVVVDDLDPRVVQDVVVLRVEVAGHDLRESAARSRR